MELFAGRVFTMLCDFECLRGRFCGKSGCPKQPWAIMGPSCAKSLENDAKMVAPGRPREHLGALKGLIGRSWVRFGRHVGAHRRCFIRFVREKCDFVTSMPSAEELLLLLVRAPKLEPLGPKSHDRTVQKDQRNGRKSKTGRFC
jgi:hypothetical protein